MGLDTVELLMEIEEEFNIKISDEDAAGLGVLGDLSRHVVKMAADQRQIDIKFEVVLRKIIDILVSNYGIPREKINSMSHVVDDLGLD
ncbi:phosphopantetheine-binding protein [Simiduia aestuariiviva]|uniref:Acyl carrier protein n=1 Tax=Simiduia aestuariiviva TaxID=1510459 RepID=A0A839UMN5_9GAMM|nr:phosphopantetheine-binding protein [Simiduia aestuariiviva]MBB3169444.1 acyl carrier protein [Simiduia aestuariiviva]